MGFFCLVFFGVFFRGERGEEHAIIAKEKEQRKVRKEKNAENSAAVLIRQKEQASLHLM